MTVTITDEELDLFNKNGFTDDDVRATVENYRSQGLDDNAIRAKVQSKIDSWNAHQNVKQPINNAQGEVEEVSTQPVEQATPVLTGGVEQKVIPNWDKKGRIYYTDEQGNRIKSNVPLSRKIGNKLRATGYNIKDWLTTDVGEKAKERRKAVAMLVSAPLGIGRGITGMALSGGLGSGVYSGSEQAIEGEFKPKQLLADIGIGAGLGGALGLGGKYIAKPIAKNIARRTNIAKRRATPLAERVKPQPTQAVDEVAEAVKPQVNQEVVEQPKAKTLTEIFLEKGKGYDFEDEMAKTIKKIDSGKYTQKDFEDLNSFINEIENEALNIDNGVELVNELRNKYKNLPLEDLDTYMNRVEQFDDGYNPISNKVEPVREVPQIEQLALDFNKVDDLIPEQVAEDTAKTKERGFVDTIRQNYGDDVAKQISDKEYDVYSHEMQKANWESRTPEQKLQALNEVDNINPDVLYGKAQALNQAIQNGEPLNVAMLDGIAKNLTKAGQEIEATKHFIPTSPEGIVLETIKQTRKNTPKQVLKLKDETSQIVDEVAKTNAEIEKEFNVWLQKQNLPKQVKQYSEKGDRLALMKAMEKYRQGKIKGEFAKLEEKRLKAIDNILAKRVVKPAERKSLATQLLSLNDNNGLTPENFARLVDKHYGIQTIDVSDYAKIQELSERFINAKTDRERDVANGLIKKFIWNKQPKKWADKDRTFRNMNMLLSLPSRLLDVTSTAAFQGINALDELVAKGIDKAMGTGLRGKMSTPAEWWKSVARGAKEGTEDVNLGINTARSGEVDRYELGFHPQFENVPILGGAEKALNATIKIPDRMFYEARFDSALKDLMSTGKFTAEEAEEIAKNEALQAVFQGQGLLSESSKFVRDLLNGRIDNKPMLDNETVQNIADNIQLGNRIAPFVQTPANLIAEGLERSPLGLAKGGFEMATAKTPQQLRQAQQTLAKGITGTTGATLGGGYLLNQVPNTIGGFTNEDLYGDDVTGLPPQSIVIGDKAVSLASIPFLTIPAGLGKALLEPDKTMPERLLNATTYTGNILSDLPMLKGLGDLYKGSADIAKVGADYALGNTDLAEVGQSVGRVAGQQGANILSQYIPLSGTLGTIRNAADPYNREMMTYNENPLLGTAEYIGNRLQNRIPFASSLLPMKYNVLGEPSMRNNIENPIARTLEATISPVRIRNYTERPAEMEEMQRIQDYAMENNIKGKTTLKFAKPKRYIGRGKDKTRLTNEQYSELTRLYNGKVYDELQFLMNTPEYQSADEETKIKWVKEVMKEKKQEAEQEISDIIK